MTKSIKDKLKARVESLDSKDFEKNYDSLKSKFYDAQRVLSEKAQDPSTLESIKDGALGFTSKVAESGAKLSGTITSFMADTDLLRHLEKLTESASTVYDKALDSEYLQTHIGGGDHRLFDNGHDIFGAWDKVRDALPDDSFNEEVLGYVSALWKDVSTVKGLPFTTVNKESFEGWVDSVSGHIPGLDREYLYDLLSFDAFEVLSTGLGVVSVFFAFKHEDQEKLSDLLGSMGIVSILSANPLMGLMVISTTAFAYKKKKMELDKTRLAKSAVVTTASMAMFSILGMPILFEVVLIAFLTSKLRKNVLDNDDFHNWLKENVAEKAIEKSEDLEAKFKDYFNKKTA